MRIDAYNAINHVPPTNNHKKAVGTEKNDTSDKLEISQTGRDYQIASQAIKDTPDVRQDRVNDIKARMKAGTYDVSDNDLAEKLLSKFFND